MARSHTVFLLLVLNVVSSFGSDVPVFLWGDLSSASLKSNPLSTVNDEELNSLLKEELKERPFTVVFAEENLSVEDFSRKNSDGKTLYPYLHANLANSYYLPSAENALGVLNKLADAKDVDHVKLTDSGLSADIEPASGKFLFINLKDAREGESREDMLRRHNDFIQDMFTKLQERYDSLIGIYTAHFPSWIVPEYHSRARRQAETTADVHDLILDGLRIYAKKIAYYEMGTRHELTTMTGSSTSFNTSDIMVSMNTTMAFGDVSITLNFREQIGYWYFDSVTFAQSDTNELLLPEEELYSLRNFSYRCAQNVSFSAVNDTNKYRVTFENLKIQPFFESRNASFMDFGDSFNCVGFFSVPIWSGLFVVFILLSITFFGIMMMMDIRTMDRFDDPKGKTITITAVE